MPTSKSSTTVVAGITLDVSVPVRLQETPIPDVLPLDAQKGIWPLKTVPEALLSALFDQPEPTPAEIAQYGSVEAVPKMKTYIIVDTAKLVQGQSIIEGCDLPWRCLQKGQVAEELADVLPYLVELDVDARFTRTLLTHLPEVNEEMATLHLCHKELGIYIRTRAVFDDVWSHLRKFSRVNDKAGKWYYFRFWEGRNVAGVLGSMSEDQLATFFRYALTIVALYRGSTGWEANAYSLQSV